jgi:hypothetical protein
MQKTQHNQCHFLIHAQVITIFSLAIFVLGCTGDEVEPNNFSLTLATLTCEDLDNGRGYTQ